jgi:hypothetical protein
VADRPEEIARFLHTAEKLDMVRVGELLGEQYVFYLLKKTRGNRF